MEIELKTYKSSASVNSESNIITNRKLQNDLSETQNLKKEAIQILNDLLLSYDNFILEFETILVNNIDLLRKVADNFGRIGIMQKRKSE